MRATNKRISVVPSARLVCQSAAGWVDGWGRRIDAWGVIIDFHTHIFPPDVRERREEYVRRDPTFAEMYADPKAKIATAEDLLASMDEAGVDVSVALGFAWRQHADIVRHNDYLLEAAAKSNGRIVPFTTVNMSDGRAEAEIDRCAKAGARGLGELRPENQRWELNGDAGARLADIARRLGLILLFHVTEPVERSYPGRHGLDLTDFRSFVERNGNLKIVGAHFGGDYYATPKPDSRPHIDTAAQPYLYPGRDFEHALAGIPRHRVLFGSDFPLIRQKRQIAELRGAIRDASNLKAALVENARKLLGF